MTTTPDNAAVRARLTRLHACAPAMDWLGTDRNLRQAWEQCERADWLLWLAGRIGVDRMMLVRAACRCARESLPIFEQCCPGDDRPRKAIETAEAWCEGRANLADLRKTAAAAAVASASVADAAHAPAAAAASAAAAAAYAAAIYACAAAYAAASTFSAKEDVLRRMAAMVREVIPYEAVEAAWNITGD